MHTHTRKDHCAGRSTRVRPQDALKITTNVKQGRLNKDDI